MKREHSLARDIHVHHRNNLPDKEAMRVSRVITVSNTRKLAVSDVGLNNTWLEELLLPIFYFTLKLSLKKREGSSALPSERLPQEDALNYKSFWFKSLMLAWFGGLSSQWHDNFVFYVLYSHFLCNVKLQLSSATLTHLMNDKIHSYAHYQHRCFTD